MLVFLQVIRQYVDLNNKRNAEAILDLFAATSHVIYPSATLHSREAYLKHLQKTFRIAGALMSKQHVTPEVIVVEGSVAIARWDFEYSL